MFLPAMSGAEPCTGSKSEGILRVGLMLALGAMPMVPVHAGPKSLRMSPKRLLAVKIAERHYRLTPVELGVASGAWRPVIKGLVQGAEIGSEGALHMNNERKRAELE